MSETLQIACDEAGHTGPDLLNAEQRYFGYGSVSIPDDEAQAMIDAALLAHPVQMKELKAARLMQGRGDRATVHLHAQAIIAIRETVLEWIRAHAALAERLGKQ